MPLKVNKLLKLSYIAYSILLFLRIIFSLKLFKLRKG